MSEVKVILVTVFQGSYFKSNPSMFFINVKENEVLAINNEGDIIELEKELGIKNLKEVKDIFNDVVGLDYKVIYETKEKFRLFKIIGRRLREGIKKIFNSNS